MNRLLLLKAVEFSSRAITGKTSLPVLECLHLKGDGERLQVTGYNLDLWARMWVESDLVIDCCAPAGRLKTLLTNFTGEDVTLTDSSISGPQRAPLQTQPGSEFPEIPAVKGKPFKLPGDAISKVMMAASTEAQRYVLQSVFLDPKGFCVGTDGRRAHFVKVETGKDPVIIPIGAAKLLAGEEGEMRACFEKDRTKGIFIATGSDWEIGGKLIEGEFPKWGTFTPGEAKGIPVTADFIAAIERAMRCAGPATAPWIEVHPGFIRATDYDSEPFETGAAKPFKGSPQFLVEAMKAAGGGTLDGCGNEPIVVSNGDFRAVVMPMRL